MRAITTNVVLSVIFFLAAVTSALPSKDIHAKPNYHLNGAAPIARAPVMPPATQLSGGYGDAGGGEKGKTADRAPSQSKEWYEEYSETQENDGKLGATATFISLSFLIVATLVFEVGKDCVLEAVEGSRAIVMVEVVFSELTVLGFIGFISFLLEQTPLFTVVSVLIWPTPTGRRG